MRLQRAAVALDRGGHGIAENTAVRILGPVGFPDGRARARVQRDEAFSVQHAGEGAAHGLGLLFFDDGAGQGVGPPQQADRHRGHDEQVE